MADIIYTPFTYLIGWSAYNKWYYGVRYARDCHPNDLWNKYFTSSKYVQEFREKLGEPDVVEVRQTFNDSSQAREWEYKVLRRLNVIKDDKWINKTDNKVFKHVFGEMVSEKTRQKLSIIKKEQYKNNPESNPFFNRRCYKEDNSFFGKKHTEESIAKIREKRSHQILTEHQIHCLRTANTGKKFSDEHKNKISTSLKNKPKSEEHKQKLRKPKSEEAKQNMRLAKAKKREAKN